MRLVTAKVTLTPREWQEFRHLPGPERKLNDWLFGRIAAKDAVRVLWHARYGERLFPADIEVEVGAGGWLTARHRGAIPAAMFPAVGFAHMEDIAVGLAGFCSHLGVEIVRVKPRETGFEELAFSADERELLQRLGPAQEEWVARLWGAKEAVAKALGRNTGLGAKGQGSGVRGQEMDSTSPISEPSPWGSDPSPLAPGPYSRPLALTVRDVLPQTGQVLVTLGPLLAATFPEFAATPLIAYTVRQEDLVVATTFLERGSS